MLDEANGLFDLALSGSMRLGVAGMLWSLAASSASRQTPNTSGIRAYGISCFFGPSVRCALIWPTSC